jgi:hypothetical protein
LYKNVPKKIAGTKTTTNSCFGLTNQATYFSRIKYFQKMQPQLSRQIKLLSWLYIQGQISADYWYVVFAKFGFFGQKSIKIAENCDQNIDPSCRGGSCLIFSH